MPKGTNQKLKLYRLAQIMLENTDDEHYITMPEIMEELGKYEVTADRKTIYADLRDLSVLGIEVEGEPIGNRYHYRVVNRPFELPELKLLVDSIQSSKFITEKKTNTLIKKLEKLVSKYDAQRLQRQVYVSGRIKTMNESIYYTVDAIHNAISENKKIKFQYFQWNVKKEMVLRKDGEPYIVSPWALTWDDENYYMVAIDSSDEKVKHFRVDKMLNIEFLDKPRLGGEKFSGQNADVGLYAKKVFGMFSGKEEIVKLECKNEMAGVIIDRFGKDTMFIPKDDEHFTANMESLLDGVEEGNVNWKTVVRNFYPDLDEAVKAAQKDLEKVKIEDEVTDVICDVCGRNMVVKYGPHGKFLACPGFPECRNTKPYLEKIGVTCPKCGKEVVLRKTKKGRKYFGCEDNPECDFMSWSRPVAEKCPKCGGYMVIKGNKIVCADEQCGYVTDRKNVEKDSE